MNKKIIKAYVDSFREGFRELVATPPKEKRSSEHTARKGIPVHHPEKSGFCRWWEVENAKFYRNQCFPYGQAILRSSLSLSNCFSDSLQTVFRSVSGFRFCHYYESVQMEIISAHAYLLKPEYDSRNIALKQVLLDKCREALVRYAYPQYDLTIYQDYVITDMWLCKGVLYMAVPWSGFYYQHYSYAQILMDDDLKKRFHYMMLVDEL